MKRALIVKVRAFLLTLALATTAVAASQGLTEGVGGGLSGAGTGSY